MKQAKVIVETRKHTDTEIDHKVYVMYGLTEEEIKIVDGNA